jgi:hypothetical protein
MRHRKPKSLAAFLKASRTSLGLVLAFFAIAREKITSAGRNIEAQCFRANLKQVGAADRGEYSEAAAFAAQDITHAADDAR